MHAPQDQPKPSANLSVARLFFIVVSISVPLWLFINPDLWYWVIGPLHQPPPSYPFLDMHGRLAHMEMSVLGWDVYQYPNPIDPGNRINNKPSVTLILGQLGLGVNHLVPVSFLCIFLFFLSTLLLVQPHNWVDSLVATLFVISPPILLLLERANDDMLIFILCAPLPYLLTRKRNIYPFLGWALISIGAMIKIYPLAAYTALIRFPGRRFTGLAFFGAGVVFFLAYFALNYAELSFLRGRFPSPQGILSFGATEWFRINGFSSSAKLLRWIAFLILILLASIIFLRQPKSNQEQTRDSSDIAFLLGASLLTFCFFLSTNWDYRWVFLLLLLPKLLEERSSSRRPIRIVSWIMSLWIPAMLYLEYLGLALGFTGNTWKVPYLQTVHQVRQILIWGTIFYIAITSARIYSAVFPEVRFPGWNTPKNV